MAVNFPSIDPAQLHPVAGVTLGWAEANIRKPNRKDVLVISVDEGASVAGVFTLNRFCAAPVTVCREHLAKVRAGGKGIRALVVNTGNANAGTGEPGMKHARETCDELARLAGLESSQVLPFSTGVILEPLPIDRLKAGLPAALANRKAANWYDAAQAIMTTDTLPKAASRQVTIDGHTVTLTGISKGAGMIRPNMATMLSFLATDAGIAQPLLTKLAGQIADKSFNRITVDGDTSTNDSFIIIATGKSGLVIESEQDAHYAAVAQALTAAALELAQKIVRDAEGATKFITIQVDDAGTQEEALKVAYAVAHSPLVKTAFFASDPNLGRILAAIGYAGIADMDASKVKLWLGDVLVSNDGGRTPSYKEEDGQRIMKEAEIAMRISLGRGQVSETVYTCDFSHESVSINADYRS